MCWDWEQTGLRQVAAPTGECQGEASHASLGEVGARSMSPGGGGIWWARGCMAHVFGPACALGAGSEISSVGGVPAGPWLGGLGTSGNSGSSLTTPEHTYGHSMCEIARSGNGSGRGMRGAWGLTPMELMCQSWASAVEGWPRRHGSRLRTAEDIWSHSRGRGCSTLDHRD